MFEVSSPPERPDSFSEDWLEEEPDNPLLEDFGNLMSSPRISREASEQIAQALATSGQTEANVPPDQRLLLDDLFALTQRVVAAETGLPVKAEPDVVGRGAWARRTVREWRRYTEELVMALQNEQPDGGGGEDLEFPSTSEGDFLFKRLMESLTPTMAALWIGTAVGRLARSSLASYDIPVPRGETNKTMLVAPNIRRKAKAWNLSLEDTGLWVGLHSNTMACLMGIPHVTDRLNDLICEYMRTCLRFRLEDAAQSIGEGFMNDHGKVQQIFSTLDSLLSVEEDAGGEVKEDLEAFVGILLSYADFITEQLGRQMLGTQSPVHEAFRRRRLNPPSEYGSSGRLFGMDVSTSGIRRGAAFVDGVVERADSKSLGRLWGLPENLPTPNEVDAPGLWLARIDLQGETEN